MCLHSHPFGKSFSALRQARGLLGAPCCHVFAFLISVALDSVLDSAGDPVGGCGGKSKLTLLSSSMHWNLCAQPYNRHFTSERESHSHRHSEGRIRVFVHSPDLICYTLVPPNRFSLRFLKWNKIPNSTKIGVRWRNSVKYKFAAIFLVLYFWSGGRELGATAFYVKSIPC